MQVVREQIMRALTVKPNSLDQFKSRLQNLSYTEILKIRQSERMNQEDFQSRPILWVSLCFSLSLHKHMHRCTPVYLHIKKCTQLIYILMCTYIYMYSYGSYVFQGIHSIQHIPIMQTIHPPPVDEPGQIHSLVLLTIW